MTSPSFPPAVAPLSRRGLLGLIGAAAVVSPALAACGADGSAPAPAADPTASAQRGGTARLAFTGTGATESLDPTMGTSPVELALFSAVFDELFYFVDGLAQPGLAASAQVTGGGGSVTLDLREGVTWHDGSPLTAADVVHTLRHRASPDRAFPTELAAYLDLDGAEATDAHTVTVPTTQPVGDPATLIASSGIRVIRDGTQEFDPATMLGTGPYRLTAWEPGAQARLARFDDYWDGAAPADEVVLLSIADAQARVNAVRTDQADYASDISWATAETGIGAEDVEIRRSDDALRTSYGFVMNLQRPLCRDPEVRRAIRLGVDRQALVDAVFLGNGAVGNDLFGYGARYFLDSAPVLDHDPDQARQILADAGAEGAEFVVRSAEYETGIDASAELFVEQMQAIGLDARLDKVGIQQGFDPQGMTTCDAMAFPLGPFSLHVTYARSAAYPTLAFPDEELREALATAISTTSESERATAWATAQQVMADRGNWVIWGRGDVLSAAKKTLVGVEARESPKYPWLGKVGFSG